MPPRGTAVEKRVHELMQEMNRLYPIRQAALDNLAKIFKRRATAVDKLRTFMGGSRPSNHVRSLRARFKVSKKVYATELKKVKWHFAEQYAKKKHQLMTDAGDTFKQVVLVRRYIDALTDKLDALEEERQNELNSEAWNEMIHDKRLLIDSQSQQNGGSAARASAFSPVHSAGRGRAKAKAKASGRPAASSGRVSHVSSAPVVDGEATPPPPGTESTALSNFYELDVRSFKGPWAVVCGQMKAEAKVDADGRFDIVQNYVKGWPGGWSAVRCKIVPDNAIQTFLADIDNTAWRIAKADMDPNGKSVIIWQSPDKPQSIWTRTKRLRVPAPPTPEMDMPSAASRARPKAKSQVRSQSTAAPTTPPLSAAHPMGGGGVTGASPGPPGGVASPSPAEWYTEIRDGRLMWTDGISAVPAEERVTDENRQKTKMQF